MVVWRRFNRANAVRSPLSTGKVTPVIKAVAGLYVAYYADKIKNLTCYIDYSFCIFEGADCRKSLFKWHL
ncbi:hypothetical protein JOJ88_005180 [Pantoea cypripedii]|nr:hypothetical protein [Pantoea cypripedii]